MPEQENQRTIIEVQHGPKPVVETHDIHTTRVEMQPIPDDTQVHVPEDTKYSETIVLDGKPQEQTVAIPIRTQPQEFEIQIGFPSQPQTTTSSVTTETTTTTTTTTQIVEEPGDVPHVLEGDTIHKTSVVVHDEETPQQPVNLVIQMPDKRQQVSQDVVTETTRTITSSMKTLPEDEVTTDEVHSETIEIVPEEGPQEVSFQFSIPGQQIVEKDINIERRTSIQKYEVEIQEKTMKMKPKQTEIVIPSKEKSTQDIDILPSKDVPRPTDEQIEETRTTIEHKSPEETMTSQTTEVQFTLPAESDEEVINVEIQAPEVPTIVTERETIKMLETEISAPDQPTEVIERAVIEVSQPDVQTEAPIEQLEISERTTVEIIKEPQDLMDTIEIDIDLGEQVTDVEERTQTITQESVVKTISFEAPEDEETHTEEIVLDIQQQPEEQEVQLTLQIDQTDLKMPETTTKEEDTSTVVKKVTFDLPEETEEIPVEEVHKDEITLQLAPQPEDELTEMTIQLGESETMTTTESSEQIEQQFTFKIPQSTYVDDEMTLSVEERPSEATQPESGVVQEKAAPEQSQTITFETTGDETMEVFELPTSERTVTEEIVIGVEDSAPEEAQFTFSFNADDTAASEDVTPTTVLESQDTQAEEITFQLEEKPLDEAEIISETTTKDQVQQIEQQFTFQIPDTTDDDENIIQIEQVPGEEAEITLEFGVGDSTTETEETTVTRTTTIESTESTFELSDIPTESEEITIQLHQDRPQEEVELRLTMPEQIQDVTKIVVTKEESDIPTQKMEVREATKYREVFDMDIPADQAAPEFTWGLTSLKVMDGEEAKFRCEVEGIPTPEISWFHDEKPIAENQDFKLSYNPETGACSLLIVEVFPQDAGEYVCVAINKYGKAVTRAFLEVECKCILNYL